MIIVKCENLTEESLRMFRELEKPDRPKIKTSDLSLHILKPFLLSISKIESETFTVNDLKVISPDLPFKPWVFAALSNGGALDRVGTKNRVSVWKITDFGEKIIAQVLGDFK